EHHPAFEEYCETIFELREDDLDVIQARIADRLRVSRPSVSEMIKRMSDESLIEVAGGKITLTVTGEELAVRVVRRHRIAERFITDILGLSWSLAHREAGRWEHVMSHEVEVAMSSLLGEPTTCPHGNPIPGSGYTPPSAKKLSELSSGQAFTVSRIPEELEFTPGMLEFLENSHLVPGSHGTVQIGAEAGDMTVLIDGTSVTVDSYATARILVTV
ncbi:MAG: metal-dependent transcriptional regulator, partial [Ilumatobacteraceae bacterium]|nr:metal-dependent transcriptional regulator [Ilumatobacteraceae bacterium]